MKKRTFLAPLAMSVAALISGAPASATAPGMPAITQEDAAMLVQTEGFRDPFVIERSGEAVIQTAQHRSHWSHRSHASHVSHRSHYSSGW